MKIFSALLLMVSAVSFAQNRFEGTWEMKMDTIELSGPPEEYLLKDGIYHCLTCVPKVDVTMDGTDQKVAGHAGFDTIAVRIVDASSVEFAFKKDGKPIFSCTETISKNGNTMVEEFSESPTVKKITGHATFIRIGSAPANAHALSGSWQMRTIRNVSGSGPTTTYHLQGDAMVVNAGNQKFEATLDGREYPVEGEKGHTVALKFADPDTIDQTEKQDGKIIRAARMIISRDGKTMKVESTDAQRGSQMTYTAEKKPAP
jgi:hypothetical protein